MPWVQSMNTLGVIQAALVAGVEPACCYDADDNLPGALQWAATVAGDGPLVVAGSLYLVSDLLRLVRDAEHVNLQFWK